MQYHIPRVAQAYCPDKFMCRLTRQGAQPAIKVHSAHGKFFRRCACTEERIGNVPLDDGLHSREEIVIAH